MNETCLTCGGPLYAGEDAVCGICLMVDDISNDWENDDGKEG